MNAKSGILVCIGFVCIYSWFPLMQYGLKEIALTSSIIGTVSLIIALILIIKDMNDVR